MDLLSVLTSKLRVASQQQLSMADAGWNERMVRMLVSRRLLASARFTIAVIDAGDEPFVQWQPGQSAPDSGSIAYLGRRRLSQSQRKSQTVVWATERAAALVGGIGGKLRQPWQVSHDLGVASIYFHLRRTAEHAASQWISEDIYRRDIARTTTEKIADAFLMSESEKPQLAIELVGDYSAARLRDFHQFWSNRGVAYEWR
ncbi:MULTISPECIES: hypothetical protein [Rhodopirellula]|nr:MULTISPECIES: hypothetical protein [Rhodopirellula]WDQ17010.1 hypothetical protein PSR62_00305 [Rhodopirellula sp. P2]|tara:strand:- start:19502 stop:20104 length:603 start_codon:yes stop_codon:yes gene_type:complete